MRAVIFEVTPAPGRREDYLRIAAGLRPALLALPGFLSVERFASLTDPDRLLSLSFFEDDAAVARWRQTEEHRLAQQAGRGGVFADYRLRVAEVARDYSMIRRDQAPADSRARHG